MYLVYKHTCPNNKVYIGLTGKDAEVRWAKGLGYQNNRHFSRAIKKYGWDNIKHEIIKDNLTLEDACSLEIELIAKYQANNPNFGYNCAIGGECGRSGVKTSEETKQKLRQANLGKKRSAETRRRISEAQKGRISSRRGVSLSEETKQKIGQANKGHKHTEETKQKISRAMKQVSHKTGYKLSEEHKKHISDALKGKSKSAEHVEHARLAKIGKTFSEEHKKHLSEALTNYYANKK